LKLRYGGILRGAAIVTLAAALAARLARASQIQAFASSYA